MQKSNLVLILRGFVVLGVILMHTSWFFDNGKGENLVTLSSMLLEVLSLFAVPLFMAIAGYLFVGRNKHAYIYSAAFFKKMLFSVLSPYLLFSALYIVSAYVFEGHKYTLGEITLDMLTGSAAVHLGFFRALIGFYLVYPFLIKIFTGCRRRGTLKYYFAAVILLQISWKVLNNIAFTEAWISYALMLTLFLRYIVYFSLGMTASYYKKELLAWIGKSRQKLVWLLVIFIPLVAVCWLEKYYWKTYYILEFICFPLNLFLYTILIAMLFYHSNSIDRQNSLQKRFILYLGNYSFGIFLIHIFFMYLCTEYLLPLLRITPSMLAFYPLLFVLMLVLSLGSMEILARLPFHEYLIGKVERRFLLGGRRPPKTDDKTGKV